MLETISVFAVDVGSLRNIGWARVAGADLTTGKDLDELVGHLLRDLATEQAVALGFECPAFIPYPDAAAGLCRGRRGDGNHPWSAGAGAAVTAIGAQEAAYVFRGITERVCRRLRVGYDDQAFLAGELDLLVWEAFVSGTAHAPAGAESHVADARTAALEFHRRLDTRGVETDIVDTEVFNLLGAAILRAGLSDDLMLLSTPCIVVKAAV